VSMQHVGVYVTSVTKLLFYLFDLFVDEDASSPESYC